MPAAVEVRGLQPDGEEVWVATADQGVWHGEGDGWQGYTSGEGLADDRVRSLAVGDDGIVWAGTAAGLSRFDGRTWTPHLGGGGDGPGELGINDLDVDVGALWATSDAGLWRLRAGNWAVYTTDDGLADEDAFAVAADDGTVWVGTDRRWPVAVRRTRLAGCHRPGRAADQRVAL